MNTALAVFHVPFGRVCLNSRDRAMVPHRHREGHPILHVRGPAGQLVVEDKVYSLSTGQAVAISPWQVHSCRPLDPAQPRRAAVLYIRSDWFLNAPRRGPGLLRFGRGDIEVTDFLARMVDAVAQAMLDPDNDDPPTEEQFCDLTQVAFDQCWQWTDSGPAFTRPSLPKRDYRIRNALRLLQDRLCDTLELDEVVREVGLSQPHVVKRPCLQVGVTPDICLDALRMERATDRLSGLQPAVRTSGVDPDFSSHASFARFIIANGVVAPRRLSPDGACKASERSGSARLSGPSPCKARSARKRAASGPGARRDTVFARPAAPGTDCRS